MAQEARIQNLIGVWWEKDLSAGSAPRGRGGYLQGVVDFRWIERREALLVFQGFDLFHLGPVFYAMRQLSPWNLRRLASDSCFFDRSSAPHEFLISAYYVCELVPLVGHRAVFRLAAKKEKRDVVVDAILRRCFADYNSRRIIWI